MNSIEVSQTESSTVIRRRDRVRTGRAVSLALLFSAVMHNAAASGPEIIRVRVPAAKTSGWFPPGTELRVLTAEQLESLVGTATEGLKRQLSAEPPRLLRARHQARWDGRVLTGETELVIARSSVAPVDYELNPWSPAVLSATTCAAAGFPDGELPIHPFAEPARTVHDTPAITLDPAVDKLLGARDSGKQSIWLDRYPRQAVRLAWELQAQKRLRGRSIHLAVPGEATTVLSLEMPKAWIASVRLGRRRGPLASGIADHVRWEVEAESGRIELELLDPDLGDSPAGSDLWVSGKTQIDLRGTIDRSGGPVNWSTEWLLELDPRNPKPLEVELDPGLELIDVQGSAVRGFRIEPSTGTRRVIVTLGGELESATEVRFLAHARVPGEGPWPIPAMRPVNATWTGGATTVIIGPRHVVAECTERGGSRLFGPGSETGQMNRLVFQAVSPRSVAELVFRKPAIESSCFVRGHLFVSGSPCRLECQLDWTGLAALTPELEIELSPAWTTERVLMRGLSEPLSWHASLLPSGSTRLRVAIPATAPLLSEISLIVSASSTGAGARGPLELPRVRPVGTRIVDDAWVAWADQATMIRPTEAVGLVWIDPGQVPGLLPARAGSSNLREALGWRWIAETASGRVDREPIEQAPGASIVMNAVVDAAKQHLSLDGRLSIVAGADALEAIPIWIERPAGSPYSVIFDDPAGGPIPAPPLDRSARAALGLPEEGQAVSLAVKIAGQGEKTIHFHAEYPWTPGSPVPIVALSRKTLQRGMIAVRTPVTFRAQFKPSGLRLLDASAGSLPKVGLVALADSPDRDERESYANMDVHAFAFNEPGARLELFTEPLEPLQEAGVVREALLATSIDPNGTALHRLRLFLHCGNARSLDLVLPAGMSVVRVRRDSTDVAPIESGTSLSIPLPGASQGSKFCTIVLDYVVATEVRSRSGLIRAVLPGVSFPSLSFTWELVAPSRFQAVDCGPGLVAVDGERAVSWRTGGVELWKRAWDLLRGQPSHQYDEVISSLDLRLDESTGDELTFAEWFARWDSGPRAVIVDRLSLSRAGLGPKSVCSPSRPTAKRRSISLETLEQHGLGMAVLPSALVITTANEVSGFDEQKRYRGMVAEALLWGADRGDRFQSLPRWRGESSPRAATLGGDESVERIKLLEGWSATRFTAPGWPGRDAYLYLIDGEARVVSTWWIAAVLLVGWLSFRRRFERLSRPYLGLVVLGIAALLLDWLLPTRYATYAGGVSGGGLLILIVELSLSLGRLGGSRRRRIESSLVRRASGAALATGLLGLLLARAASGQPAIGPDGGGPMLVLFPYEGVDPTGPPQNAILRLADFNRLSRLAEAEAVAPRGSVRAVWASHRVRRKTGREVVVETELRLVAAGQAPWTWRLPVSGARDIETSLDRRKTPLSIEPGGQFGEVAIPRSGNHLLTVRRSFATKSEAGFEVLSFPVNAFASARVVLDAPEPGARAPELTATGGTHVEADGTLVGGLGPAERIALRWAVDAGGASELKGGTASVEGLILWDINLGGDRVRTRLTYQSSRELESVRLGHPEGLILRGARVVGSSGFVWCESRGKDEWALHMDPPLEAGGTIEVDSWMQFEISGTGVDSQKPNGGDARAVARRLPGVQPIGAERYSGSLGARRPGDWTGRLDTIVGSEPISDESFVQAWGSLPDDPLTLCGTKRFVRECHGSLSTGATPTRLSVKPTVQLQFEPGRVVMTVEAELSEPSGRFGLVEAKVPADLQVIQVSAPGLGHWSTTTAGSLRLMFDGSVAASRRRLRLMGWIPVTEDPLKIGSRQHRIAVPWILWQGVESLAGFLVASSISKLEVQGASGMTQISSESSGAAGTIPPRHRLTFGVDDPRQLGEISWVSIPARVSVLVDSQMTIHPDSAEWVAVLRYDVVGGALDAIHLRMPASWSGAADLHFSGSGHQLTTETRGQTAIWTITPERPIWGSQRLVLRSSRPLAGEREITHPEVSPLGRGAVDACLAVVNATGRPATIENPVGLDRVEYSSRFQAREFAAGTGAPLGAFRVVKESPILKVQLPRDNAGVGEARDGSARVGFADVTVVVMPDRSSLGQATYEAVAGSGSFLSFEIPADSKLLWATVDSNPVTPLRSKSGEWSLALHDSRQAHISLIWQTSPAHSRPAGPTWPVGLPRVGHGMTTNLVTFHVPDQYSLAGEVGGLRHTSLARLEMARADWLVRSINDFVQRIDRGSNRDHQKLVTMLIAHEMRLRSALRSEKTTLAAGVAGSEGAGDSPGWIQAARAGLVEAVRRVGLEEDLAVVNRYLGEVATSRTGPSPGVPEPNAPERIRTLGRPIPLLGVLPGVDDPPAKTSLVVAEGPWTESANEPVSGTIIAIFMFGVIGLLTTGVRPSARTNASALLMALGLAGYMGGPLALVGALGLAGLGYRRARFGSLA